MALVYLQEKLNSPVPGICVFVIAGAFASDQAFRNGCEVFGQALVASTVVLAVVAFVAFLTMSDAGARVDRSGKQKDVRNYNRSVWMVSRMMGISLLACMLFVTAAGVSTLGQTGAAALTAVLGVICFGIAIFTYLQGPPDPFEH